MVVAVDDQACMRLMRLFNEAEGWDYLRKQGLKEDLAARLPLLGISGSGTCSARSNLQNTIS